MWAADDSESGRLDHTSPAFALNKTLKSVNTIGSTDSLHPSRCLVVVYPRSLSCFALLVLAVRSCYIFNCNMLSFTSLVVRGTRVCIMQ